MTEPPVEAAGPERRRSRLRPAFLVPVILFVALAIPLGWGLTRDPSELPSPLIGKSVPDFALPPVQGRTLGLATADLRGEVESLLGHHVPSEVTVGVATAEGGHHLAEGPGTVIGRYKLLEEIGQGGMGVVYMAEQTEPVRRMVALKIIKLGMDTKEVVARFEAERQALAMMDHPNIAKVLDAGATATGRPYFVMSSSWPPASASSSSGRSAWRSSTPTPRA